MPSLEFKGKLFVFTHHLSVPFREVVVDAKKSLPEEALGFTTAPRARSTVCRVRCLSCPNVRIMLVSVMH
jgi:hypothetical protein